MTIRKVKETDANAINAIYNDYIINTTITFETEKLTDETMEQRIHKLSVQGPYLVYEINGILVGYCYAHPWKERAAYSKTYETTIYLHSNYQHQGIGTDLMKSLIEECRKQGIHALIACIAGGNEASCKLHEALGFKQVSHFREVGKKFGKWIDVVDYELILTDMHLH
ncbi:MAG TPA: N-acetyltransferase family protein [Paludibacteraceae bacterium]|jgi:phosphinothricin acetyltransferase|nr:N-acetyltransferase family protein [Paludibacteraceae bacterium]HOU69531.1 N-acetyltransferase family protein [Paludibacteraceae bacterium]HPH63123.1 N-acetyltransferase family protein [Paludibacteraceae bacterium]HQF51216.1 N-acetyltransferase family protein [Paludibacteraceae bacterium]HQJ90666.1 N-acetyltransferase family protein [Paludibacteraceae bacterium]